MPQRHRRAVRRHEHLGRRSPPSRCASRCSAAAPTSRSRPVPRRTTTRDGGRRARRLDHVRLARLRPRPRAARGARVRRRRAQPVRVLGRTKAGPTRLSSATAACSASAPTRSRARLDDCAEGADVAHRPGRDQRHRPGPLGRLDAADEPALDGRARQGARARRLPGRRPAVEQRPPAPPTSPIAELNRLIAAIGRDEGVPVIGFHDALEDPRQAGLMPTALTADGDHPRSPATGCSASWSPRARLAN